jgi:hypothetical protein
VYIPLEAQPREKPHQLLIYVNGVCVLRLTGGNLVSHQRTSLLAGPLNSQCCGNRASKYCLAPGDAFQVRAGPFDREHLSLVVLRAPHNL